MTFLQIPAAPLLLEYIRSKAIHIHGYTELYGRHSIDKSFIAVEKTNSKNVLVSILVDDTGRNKKNRPDPDMEEGSTPVE